MEDALALEPNWLSIKEASVLILVVMEDALAQRKEEYLEKSTQGLNPCCNGRCTRTVSEKVLGFGDRLS